MTPFRRLRSVRLLLPLAALVLLSACEVRSRVNVTVEEDGSGTVEVAVGLDAEALARVPDLDGDGTSGAADLAALVRTDDLEAAGWQVTEPAAAEAGDAGEAPDVADPDSEVTWIAVARRFGTPEEANAILAEITGAEGPLRDLRLERTTGFASTEISFTGTADLSGGLEAFGDVGLMLALDGEPLGEDPAQIEERIGQPVEEAFLLELLVDLPGGVDADADGTAGGVARWSPRLGDEPRALEATGTVRDWPVLVLTALAGLFVLAAVAAGARLVLARPREDTGEGAPAGPTPTGDDGHDGHAGHAGHNGDDGHDPDRTVPVPARVPAPAGVPGGPGVPGGGPGDATDGHARPDAGDARPDAGDARPDAGDARPDAGHARPDVGHARPDVGHGPAGASGDGRRHGRNGPDGGGRDGAGPDGEGLPEEIPGGWRHPPPVPSSREAEGTVPGDGHDGGAPRRW